MISRPNNPDEVTQLLLNAQLRDELEPFLDESVELVNVRQMPTSEENEFLASMLAWERAPVLPISRWFEPELVIPRPDEISDGELTPILWDTIHKLYSKRIVLDFTSHLSDRQLYCLIFRDILPSSEKRVDLPKNYLRFHCLDHSGDPEAWLRFYASHEERLDWAADNNQPLPPSEPPPFPRKMPRLPR